MNLPTTPSVRHFLVDIDMLYDVRLALLDRISPMVALAQVHKEHYQHRQSDLELADALGIKSKEWLGRYEGEFMSLLKQSHPTHLRDNLIPLTNEYLEDELPGSNQIKKLTVNIPYGFSMSGEEIEDLKYLFQSLYEGYFDEVDVIYLDHSRLHYMDVVQRYTDYFCYHYDKWIKLYHDDSPEKYKPSFRLWAPQLLWGREEDLDPKSKKEVKKLIEQHSPFTMVQFSYLPAFAVRWIDPLELLDSRITHVSPKKE